MVTKKPAARQSARTSDERTAKPRRGESRAVKVDAEAAPLSVEQAEAAVAEAERANDAAAAECRVAEALLREFTETGRLLTAEQHARVVAAANAYAETSRAFHAATVAHYGAMAKAPKAGRAKRGSK